MPCILNAANEVCVDAFLHRRIGFVQMSDVIAEAMQCAVYVQVPTYEDYVVTDKEARSIAKELVDKYNT